VTITVVESLANVVSLSWRVRLLLSLVWDLNGHHHRVVFLHR
jgi:hypothetical protein